MKTIKQAWRESYERLRNDFNLKAHTLQDDLLENYSHITIEYRPDYSQWLGDLVEIKGKDVEFPGSVVVNVVDTLDEAMMAMFFAWTEADLGIQAQV